MKPSERLALLRPTFIDLHEGGMSYAEIGKAYGFNKEAIRTCIHDLAHQKDVVRKGRELLRGKVPKWWSKSEPEYRDCVRKVFGV